MLSQKLEMKKFSALVIEVSEEDRRTKKFRKLVEQEVRVDSKSLKAATAKTSGFLFFFFLRYFCFLLSHALFMVFPGL